MPSQEELDAEQDGLFYILMMAGCLVVLLVAFCGPVGGLVYFFAL